MNILFIHQNFPGQFKHLAPALAIDPQNTVLALTMRKNLPDRWQSVSIIRYQPSRRKFIY
jgi:hypothetical protein